MPTTLDQLDVYRRQADTWSGPASYIDTGGQGRPALFVHGVITSSYLWRHVIGQFDGQCRCVALDLPLHGQTPAAAGQDFSLPGLARFVADCCDALGLTSTSSRTTPAARSPRYFAAGHPRATAHPDPHQLRGTRQHPA
jgi:pimeloyl-ACP methyl ester carboxylesterase